MFRLIAIHGRIKGLSLRVQNTQIQGMSGVYIGNHDYGFGTIPCVGVLRPLELTPSVCKNRSPKPAKKSSIGHDSISGVQV